MVAALVLTIAVNLPAADPPPPTITNINVNGNQRNLRFAPYPGAEAYQILTAPTPYGPYVTNFGFAPTPYVISASTNGTNFGYEWRGNDSSPSAFYRVQVNPMSHQDLLSSIVLNRLAYGPTPDELERVKAIGAQAYIDEQLAMEGLPEPLDEYISATTNSVPGNTADYWDHIIVTGRLTSKTFYLFLTQPGEVHVDDLELVPILYSNYVDEVVVNNVTNYVTNTFTLYGTNLLLNGDFESEMTPPWTKSGAAAGSAIDTSRAQSGLGSLRLNSMAAGSTSGSNVLQTIVTTLTNNAPVRLSYWYRRTPESSRLRVQLGGNGLVTSGGAAAPTPSWVYATATGPATSILRLYLFLNGSGDCYLDDIKLVAGTVPEAGPNLLQNGDFESGVSTPWQFTANFTNSHVSTEFARSGNASLHIVGTAAGSGSGNSVFQNLTTITNGQTYTLSYWYLPTDDGRTFTARLSGNLLASNPDADTAGLYRRMNTTQAGIADLRAWFALHAVNSRRQLFEVLSQFWENHFVTQYQKSYDYLPSDYPNVLQESLATEWESREMLKWRNAMLNPQCTFYDLLRISAESPAMIVYLDTVNSRGDGTRTANENYARELLELFCFGVDNGYDQNDIVLMSRAWTGWSVDIVDKENVDDPLAPVSTTYYPYANSTSKTNLVGRWAFNYKAANHGTNRGAIFAGKAVPARFGPPWAGRNYQLTIPPRTGTNGIQDGYDVIAHMANQPFTQEYISIKLCRLFVHEDFPNPTTDPTHPEYAFYDYTNPNRTPEADLVHQCMLAWENSNPKGQIRAVLGVIFNSELFQSHAAAAQKVKTPFEFVVSAVRALQSSAPGGVTTAATDGYAFRTPMMRIGAMHLFNRDAPDGYPEAGSSWISAGTLTERIRFVQSYSIASSTAGRPADAGNNFCDPVALLKRKLPAASWNVSSDVADYFVRTLYPGEGVGNLSLYKSAAIRFLDTADDGVTASLFSGLGNTNANYDTRVRGMVAMLMAFQRFQEQ